MVMLQARRRSSCCLLCALYWFMSLLRLLTLSQKTTTTNAFSVARSSIFRRQSKRGPTAAVVVPVSRRRMSSSDATSASTAKATVKLPPVSSKIQTTLDPCVVLMKELIGKYADRWEGRGGIFSLAQGVVWWEPPPQCQTALQEAVNNKNAVDNNLLHLYGPDEGLPELREQLRAKLATENGLTHHDVLVTVGANQAYVNCVLALLDSNGDNRAVVFEPYYFNHYMALQMTIGEDNILKGPTSNLGVPDLDWLQSQFEQQQQQSDDNSDTSSSSGKIRMVTITNPNNPTGCTQPRAVIQRAVDLCRRHNAWLVLDATYEYFVESNGNKNNNDKNDESSTNIAPAFDEPHCLHIFSLSKAYALAGYRCGYLAVHRDAAGTALLWDQLLKVQDTIPIAPSRVAQLVALGALAAGRPWVRDRIATLATGRHALQSVLRQYLPTTVGGDGAIYLWAQLPTRTTSTTEQNNDGGGGGAITMDDVAVAERLVRDFGVALIPGSFCGVPGWIRVCYANLPPEQCLQAAERLARGLREIVGNGASDTGVRGSEEEEVTTAE